MGRVQGSTVDCIPKPYALLLHRNSSCNGKLWPRRSGRLQTFRRASQIVRAEGGGATSASSSNGPGSFLGALFQPASAPVVVSHPDPSLANQDLIPTTLDQRIFSAWDIISLWVGLVVGVPSYYLAGSLVDLGMAWWQGILTVMAGNFLLFFPLVLTGHAGIKYGIPFPVMARASFGIHGAHIVTILRGLVACGWFGIETWIGGQGIYVLLNALLQGKLASSSIQWMGTPLPEWACFFSFWLLQIGIIWNGVDSIRQLEKYCAPILFVLSVALLIWAYVTAGGFGAMLAASSQFGAGGSKQGQFWQVFFPALTANIGFWATLSLNIPDFTRYAKCQADQIVGHIGLPIFMGLFTFLGLAVTSSTEVIFGRIISNPIELLGQIGGVLPILTSFIGLTLATLTTNIAANIMAPANALVNLNPNLFSFRTGALLTAVVGILFGPWQFIKNSESFIGTWLVGYSALLGPLSGIILVDYHIIRKRHLDLNALYSTSHSGMYWYSNGYNFMAIGALLLAVLPCIPGFLYTVGLLKKTSSIFIAVYDSAWIFGFLFSGFLYWVLCTFHRFWQNQGRPAEDASKDG